MGHKRQASMGPRSDNRGYDQPVVCTRHRLRASMGPRSDNRGYERLSAADDHRHLLQWVRGPITAVMFSPPCEARTTAKALQWVRGPITAVMTLSPACPASAATLQWVRGPITAVMRSRRGKRGCCCGASMGPRSDNRGYVSAS